LITLIDSEEQGQLPLVLVPIYPAPPNKLGNGPQQASNHRQLRGALLTFLL
jgi:hypothetical protein